MNKTLLKFIKVKSRIYKKIYKATDPHEKTKPKKDSKFTGTTSNIIQNLQGKLLQGIFWGQKKMQKNCGVKLDL